MSYVLSTELELQKMQTILLYQRIQHNPILNEKGHFRYSEEEMCIIYEFKFPYKQKGVIIYIPSKYDDDIEEHTDEYYETERNIYSSSTEYEIWIKIGIVSIYGEHVYEKIKDVFSTIELKEELYLMLRQNEEQMQNDSIQCLTDDLNNMDL